MAKSAKPVMKYRVDNWDKPFHFFLSSVGEWKTGKNLDDLVAKMKRSGLSFNVFYVPGPEDAEYKISCYAPQVEGAVFIGYYGFDDPDDSSED